MADRITKVLNIVMQGEDAVVFTEKIPSHDGLLVDGITPVTHDYLILILKCIRLDLGMAFNNPERLNLSLSVAGAIARSRGRSW